ncbi:MAG: NifB/NifX family molybdenum-iron cluster-binding protein [Bacteroidota bacterium]
MKIAVPSNDGINISAHFGRSKGFIIFDTDGNRISGKQYIDNTITGHAQGHHHESDHPHGAQGDHSHSHAGILGALAGCETVIAGGMGQRLYSDLQAANKKVFVTREEDAEKAVMLFLSSELDNNPDVCCRH